MSCKSILYAVNTASTAVAENGIVPFTTIVRRYGSGANLNGNTVTLTEPGYYDVSVNVTFTAPAPGTVTLTLLQNGTAIPGATASTTITTATTEVRSISFTTTVRVFCNSASVLTLSNTGLAITSSNAAITADKAS